MCVREAAIPISKFEGQRQEERSLEVLACLRLTAHTLAHPTPPHPTPPRALMRDRRAAAWRLLTPVERDALIVLTAMCKVGWVGRLGAWLHKQGAACWAGADAQVWQGELQRAEKAHRTAALRQPRLLPGWCPAVTQPLPPLSLQMAARETGSGTVESYMQKGGRPAVLATVLVHAH